MEGLSDEKAIEEAEDKSVAVNADVATHLRNVRAADPKEEKKVKKKKKPNKKNKKPDPSKRKKGTRKTNLKKANCKGDKECKNKKKCKNDPNCKKRRKKQQSFKKEKDKCPKGKKGKICRQRKKAKIAKKLKKIEEAKKRKDSQNSKQSSAVAVSGNCNNITCLNDMLEVLKVDKDTVQNYIQQKKRLDSRLSLAGLYEAKTS